MRCTLVFVAFTLLFAGAIAEVTQEEGVNVLTGDNFDDWLDQQEFALIEFYAPWCGHCKNLAPHYAEAAQKLEAEGANVKLAKVDVTENAELGERFSVRGYPTIYWYSKENNYEPTEYGGGRDADGIYQWVTKQTKSTLDIIPSQKDLLESIKDGASTVATVVQYGESAAYQHLVNLGRTVLDIAFVQVTDEAEFGDYKNGDIVLYRSHGEPIVTQFTNEEDLQSSLTSEAYPPVVEFSSENFQRLAQKAFTLIAVGDYNNEDEKEKLIEVIKAVGTNERSNDFGFMYGDSNRLARGVQGAGASGEVFPTVVAINPQSNTQFAFDESLEYNAENVGKWVDGLLDGTTQSFKKSQPIPEDTEAVKTLVAKNFDTIKGKDALVKYYAPWCGHCKTLAPIYDSVAEHFKEQGSDVVIAKIDATANYITESVAGFPTLVWYPADGEKETYEGGRTLEDIIAFVEGKISGEATGHGHDEL